MESHWETIAFNLISSPIYPVILGMSCLVMHNAIVDWRRHSINFTSWIGVGTPSALVRPKPNHHPVLELIDMDMSTFEFDSFFNMALVM